MFFSTWLPWQDASIVFAHDSLDREGVRIPESQSHGFYAYVVVSFPKEGGTEDQLLIFRPFLDVESEHEKILLDARLDPDGKHYQIRCGGTLLFNHGELARWSLKSGGCSGKDPTLALDAAGWPAPSLTDFPELPLPRQTYMPLGTAREVEMANARGESVEQMLNAASPPAAGAAAPAHAGALSPATAPRPASDGSALSSPTGEGGPPPFDCAVAQSPLSTSPPRAPKLRAPSPSPLH